MLKQGGLSIKGFVKRVRYYSSKTSRAIVATGKVGWEVELVLVQMRIASCSGKQSYFVLFLCLFPTPRVFWQQHNSQLAEE
jgi:hypothetical protein